MAPDQERVPPSTHSQLIRALVELLTFLEFTGDDRLDPDAAVAQMESTAALLQELPEDSRAAVVQEIRAIADEIQDPTQREFVANLPRALGLLDS